VDPQLGPPDPCREFVEFAHGVTKDEGPAAIRARLKVRDEMVRDTFTILGLDESAIDMIATNTTPRSE